MSKCKPQDLPNYNTEISAPRMQFNLERFMEANMENWTEDDFLEEYKLSPEELRQLSMMAENPPR